MGVNNYNKKLTLKQMSCFIRKQFFTYENNQCKQCCLWCI